MATNIIAEELTRTLTGLSSVIEKLRTGEGLNLTEEQQKQYKEELERQGASGKFDEIKKSMELLKNKIDNADNQTNG